MTTHKTLTEADVELLLRDSDIKAFTNSVSRFTANYFFENELFDADSLLDMIEEKYLKLTGIKVGRQFSKEYIYKVCRPLRRDELEDDW